MRRWLASSNPIFPADMPVRDLLTSLGVKGGDLPRVSSKALVVIRKKSMRKVWTSRTRRGGLGHLAEAMCVISDLVCNVMRGPQHPSDKGAHPNRLPKPPMKILRFVLLVFSVACCCCRTYKYARTGAPSPASRILNVMRCASKYSQGSDDAENVKSDQRYTVGRCCLILMNELLTTEEDNQKLFRGSEQ